MKSTVTMAVRTVSNWSFLWDCTFYKWGSFSGKGPKLYGGFLGARIVQVMGWPWFSHENLCEDDGCGNTWVRYGEMMGKWSIAPSLAIWKWEHDEENHGGFGVQYFRQPKCIGMDQVAYEIIHWLIFSWWTSTDPSRIRPGSGISFASRVGSTDSHLEWVSTSTGNECKIWGFP